ncbi:MAG: YeeE/YedE family protein [Oceanicaulis sp.]
MTRLLSSLLAGLVFGLGLVISGMVNPAKVQNFLDVAGAWDPSLALVMGAALIVTAIGYKLVLRLPHPLFEASFQIPQLTRIDARLLGGAAVFGAGWGLAGFCPGPAITAATLGRWEVFLFLAAMLAGIGLWRWVIAPMIAPKPA